MAGAWSTVLLSTNKKDLLSRLRALRAIGLVPEVQPPFLACQAAVRKTARLTDPARCFETPPLDAPVQAAGKQLLSIGTEHEAGHGTGMAGKRRPERAAACQIPQLNSAIGVAGGERRPIRGERQAGHCRRIAQRQALWLVADNIPQLDGAALIAGG